MKKSSWEWALKFSFISVLKSTLKHVQHQENLHQMVFDSQIWLDLQFDIYSALERILTPSKICNDEYQN